jgi:general secretion pathway protein H
MRNMPVGYTLLELLVVIAIIGLISAFAAPPLARSVASASLHADARRLASDLRHLQRLAEQRQQTIALASNGSSLAIEPDAGVVLPDAGIALQGDAQTLFYYADGTSSGGTLRLSENGQGLDVHVAWLTGAVSLGDGNDAR